MVWSLALEDKEDLAVILLAGCVRAHSQVKVVGEDGRFVAYDNGTVQDTDTGLMWAAKDNGAP